MRAHRHSPVKARRVRRLQAPAVLPPSPVPAAAFVPFLPASPVSTPPSRAATDGTSPHDARIEALKGRSDMRSTGARFLKRELKRMKTFVREGRPCRVVFDLDNTLFDTRARTLAVGHSFDAARALRGEPPIFAGVTKLSMGYDATHTIAALRKAGVLIDDETEKAFVAHWEREFWSAAMMVHDDPMHEILFWAHAAHDIGVEVLFLTGRSSMLPDGTPSGFERSSYDELQRAGLSWVKEDDIHVKPTVDTNTLAFKIDRLRAWRAGAYVGWFLTEGSRHVAGIEKDDPSTPCVHLPCSLDDDEGASRSSVPAHVPRLERVI